MFFWGSDKMRANGVICEYNPFHKGHKYLLDEIKKDNGNPIVAVMSGSFTQRGDVAILSKFERTKQALNCGADLVIELPTPFALSSAEKFAYGGCETLKALGLVDKIFFGSECGNSDEIITAAKATKDERVLSLLREYMGKGEYYPLALEKAVREIFGDEIAEIISSPNNTLGVEYTKQVLQSDIEIKTVKRIGEAHDSESDESDFVSASLIRKRVYEGEDVSKYLPYEISFENPAFFEYGERAILQKLRSLSPEDFEKLPDVSEGLHNRIYDAVRKENTLENILNTVKTKRYTMARLRRILTCAMLDITKELQSQPVSYIRVLGFNSNGETLLKELKARAKLPIIINVARDILSLDEQTKRLFEIDIKATDLRTVFEKNPTPCGLDFSQGLVKI